MELREIKGLPDYSDIIELINAEWPPESEWGEKTEDEKVGEMIRSHNLKTDTVKYLFEDNRVIGFYRYTRWPRENPDPHKAHTLDIAILPSMQKQGLGGQLMADMIEDCRHKGFQQLLSRSMRNNRGSIKLHQSSGFTVYMETEDSIVWELNPQLQSFSAIRFGKLNPNPGK